MRRLAGLALAALSACATVGRRDQLLAAGYGVLLATDYAQTRGITARGLEANPFMGEHGDRVPPAVYFTGLAALGAASLLLPDRWRPVALGALLGVEGNAVSNNFAIGFYPW